MKKYIIWFTAKIHGGLDPFSLDFETVLLLGLEVVMRFKALHDSSNIICCVEKITPHYHGVEIYLLLCLQLRNLTNFNEVKSTTYMNHGKEKRLEFRSRRFQEEHMTSVWQKQLGFCLGINRFWVRVSLP